MFSDFTESQNKAKERENIQYPEQLVTLSDWWVLLSTQKELQGKRVKRKIRKNIYWRAKAESFRY